MYLLFISPVLTLQSNKHNLMIPLHNVELVGRSPGRKEKTDLQTLKFHKGHLKMHILPQLLSYSMSATFDFRANNFKKIKLFLHLTRQNLPKKE